MRISCPYCGPRDRREFYYMGAAAYLDRPGPDADFREVDDHLHNRDNPAGVGRELWQHEAGCRAWLVVTRNMTTHEILSTEPAPGCPAPGEAA